MARAEIPVTDVTPVKATLTTSLTGADNDLVFTAKKGGQWGNSIQVEYIDPSAASQSLAITVDGFTISVSLATDGASAITTTAADITSKVAATRDAAALVDVDNASSNDGTGVVTALTATALTGGEYAVDQPSQTNGDATNGHYVATNDGQFILEVVSSDAGSQTVTIYFSPTLVPGVRNDDPEVVTVGAGDTRYLGPFPKAQFAQDSDGLMHIDVSVSTNLKFRAYKVAKPT